LPLSLLSQHKNNGWQLPILFDAPWFGQQRVQIQFKWRWRWNKLLKWQLFFFQLRIWRREKQNPKLYGCYASECIQYWLKWWRFISSKRQFCISFQSIAKLINKFYSIYGDAKQLVRSKIRSRKKINQTLRSFKKVDFEKQNYSSKQFV